MRRDELRGLAWMANTEEMASTSHDLQARPWPSSMHSLGQDPMHGIRSLSPYE